jgi:hypothetical protein
MCMPIFQLRIRGRPQMMWTKEKDLLLERTRSRWAHVEADESELEAAICTRRRKRLV